MLGFNFQCFLKPWVIATSVAQNVHLPYVFMHGHVVDTNS